MHLFVLLHLQLLLHVLSTSSAPAVAAAAAAAAAHSPPASAESRLMEALTASPIQLEAAQKLCESGLLAKDSLSQLRLVDRLATSGGTTNYSVDEVLLRAIQTTPSAIGLLACLVDRAVLNIATLPDRGASILSAAAVRKHMRLLTLSLKQGAALTSTDPLSGFGLLHDAIHNKLLVLDVTSRLLYSGGASLVATENAASLQSLQFIRSSRTLHDAQIREWENRTAFTCSAEPDGAAALRCTTKQPPLEIAESYRIIAAANALLACERRAGLRACTTIGVDGVSTAADALSHLMLRILLEQDAALPLVTHRDALGRTPLHVAASAGNVAAVQLLIRKRLLGLAPAEQYAALAEYVNAVDAAGLSAAALACDAAQWRSVSIFVTVEAQAPPCPHVSGERQQQQQQQQYYHRATMARGASTAGASTAALWCASSCQSRTDGDPAGDLLDVHVDGAGGVFTDDVKRSHLSGEVAASTTGDTVPLAVAVTSTPVSLCWPRPQRGLSRISAAAIDVAVQRALDLASSTRNRRNDASGGAAYTRQQQRTDGGSHATHTDGSPTLAISDPSVRSIVARQCEFDVVDASEWATDPHAEAAFAPRFLREYATRRRPVLLRGAAAGWTALHNAWSAASLLSGASSLLSTERAESIAAADTLRGVDCCAGDVRFTVSQIPYEKSFRPDGAAFSLPLRDHVYALLCCTWARGHSGGELAVECQSTASDNSSASSGAASTSLPARRVDHDALCGRYTSAATSTLGASAAPPSRLEPDVVSGADEYPFYIFDAPLSSSLAAEPTLSSGAIDVAAAARSALLRHLPLVPAFLDIDVPTAMSTETRDGGVPPRQRQRLVSPQPPPKPQFYAGGPGSGAPSHFHKDAWNVASTGLKRWYVYPPACSVYSNMPVAHWVAAAAAVRGTTANWSSDIAYSLPPLQDASGGIAVAGCAEPPTLLPRTHMAHGENGLASRLFESRVETQLRPLECSQEANDIVFVPSGWGHAVLNLELSVGAAVEFSSPLGRY